jgi:hypothetical protein
MAPTIVSTGLAGLSKFAQQLNPPQSPFIAVATGIAYIAIVLILSNILPHSFFQYLCLFYKLIEKLIIKYGPILF